MYPTMYHALVDLTGLDLPLLKFVNSFGFFVALAFYAANRTLVAELRRRLANGQFKASMERVTIGLPASMGDFATSVVVGFLLGWKGVGLCLQPGAVADPQAFLLSGQGSWLGGAVLGALFLWLRYRESQKNRLPEPRTEERAIAPHDHATNITMTAAIWGILGAKLFHWLENPDEFLSFVRDPSATDLVAGLTMYGGLILGGFMVIRYFRRHGIPALVAMDATAPGLMLAYAIGRIGCQVSGDGDWGIVNLAPTPAWLPDWLWAYDYPNNVNGQGVPMLSGTRFPGYSTHLPHPVFPTALYETIVCSLFFALLWWARKRMKTPGVLFCAYLMLNGTERFWIEKIRVNVKVWGQITQAEIIAVLLFSLGAAGWWWLTRAKPHASA
jgi:phosphatidylglycerol---prolipoprotein diacylglyceryl transferase